MVLQASQSGFNVENGRIVYGNARLIQKREFRVAFLWQIATEGLFCFLGGPGLMKIIKLYVFSKNIYGENNEKQRQHSIICLSSNVQYCTAVLLL